MARKKLLRPRHEPEYDEPVWFGLARSTGMTWIALSIIVVCFFFLGIAGFLGILGLGVLIPVLLLILFLIVCIAALADVKVLIDSKGVHVRCGAFNRPQRFIPWSDVESLNAGRIRPRDWGGWGYRWRPSDKGTAVIMREGEGITVHQKNGKLFVVTLDGAEDAAAFAQQFID